MTNNNYIFKLNHLDRTTSPNYFDYGIVIDKIKQTLWDQLGIKFTMYADDETSNELFEVLEEDLEENQEEVTFISHIFEGVETFTISSKHTKDKLELMVKPRVKNAIYYYPKFRVAIARTIVFQNHSENTHDFVLAQDNNCIVEYLNYVIKRKRDNHRNFVTVYTDTDDGVETKKEKITNLVNRDQVFLEENLKKEIFRAIDQFFTDDGHFFTTYNIPYKRGILLYGKPGNGKTTLVKSIANSIDAPVVYWQITEHTSSYTIREVFSSVAKIAPMVLVIEDIDSMPEHVRSVFLNILDGSTSKEGIFLIGTTNYPEKIDPALINRSGRFDRAYELKLPTKEMRKQYLVMKKMDQFLSEEDLNMVVEKTNSFSFAQLNELYTSVALQWHYEQKVDIESICSDLASDNKKTKNTQWNTDLDSRVGFGN